MTDKELDNLFSKQDIKLSADFNEAVFEKIKDADNQLDAMLSEEKLRLNSDFNDVVLDESRIDSFFTKEPIKLGDAFCDDLFAKLKDNNVIELPRRSIWRIVASVSSIAAVFLSGVFVASSHFSKDELLPETSQIYTIANENIKTEIDYFLHEDEMNRLSQEIDILEASMLELSIEYSSVSANI